MADIKDNILATLAYYDVLDFPLTAEEVSRYLIRLSSDEDIPKFSHRRQGFGGQARILEYVEALMKEGKIGKRDGHYYLFGRDYLVPLRSERLRYWHKKWKRTLMATRLISVTPFLRGVFASGSLALKNTSELSDLDILLVTSAGRIATARFCMTILLDLFGFRRKPIDTVAPNLICPNHFVALNNMTIPAQNIYTAQLYANIVPVMIRGANVASQFQNSNSWVLHYIYNWEMLDKPDRFRVGPALASIVEWVLGGTVGDWLESKLFNWQKRRVEHNPLTSHSHGRILFSQNEIAFHPDSPDERFIEPYKERLVKLGIK